MGIAKIEFYLDFFPVLYEHFHMLLVKHTIYRSLLLGFIVLAIGGCAPGANNSQSIDPSNPNSADSLKMDPEALNKLTFKFQVSNGNNVANILQNSEQSIYEKKYLINGAEVGWSSISNNTTDLSCSVQSYSYSSFVKNKNKLLTHQLETIESKAKFFTSTSSGYRRDYISFSLTAENDLQVQCSKYYDQRLSIKLGDLKRTLSGYFSINIQQ